ncbi:MAG TPA: 4Fe-4S binding protein, partial [Azonexus sp.]|nr:4Fe-4S binding protein [Azonexus sp.]
MKLHRILALVALYLFWSATSHASSYDAALPPQLFTDPDLCAYAPCRDVLPGADSFSVRKGRPSYVEAYRTVGAQRQVIGYVFLST